MKQQRNIAVAIILSIITCGIYGIYWFVKLNDEVNEASGNPNDTSGGLAFLFSIITCGIYTIFWNYKMGQKVDQIKAANGGADGNTAILYVIFGLVGLEIVTYALMQDELNKIA